MLLMPPPLGTCRVSFTRLESRHPDLSDAAPTLSCSQQRGSVFEEYRLRCQFFVSLTKCMFLTKDVYSFLEEVVFV